MFFFFSIGLLVSDIKGVCVGGFIWKVCIWFSLERCVEIKVNECCIRANRNLFFLFFCLLLQYSKRSDKLSRDGRKNQNRMLPYSFYTCAHNRKIRTPEKKLQPLAREPLPKPILFQLGSGLVKLASMRLL